MNLDALHVVLGLIIAFASIIASQRCRRAPICGFVIALALALGMEAADFQRDMALSGSWRWRLSVNDVIRTIAAPALLVSAQRLWQARRIC